MCRIKFLLVTEVFHLVTECLIAPQYTLLDSDHCKLMINETMHSSTSTGSISNPNPRVVFNLLASLDHD
jgi:hypothetical protein